MTTFLFLPHFPGVKCKQLKSAIFNLIKDFCYSKDIIDKANISQRELFSLRSKTDKRIDI